MVLFIKRIIGYFYSLSFIRHLLIRNFVCSVVGIILNEKNEILLLNHRLRSQPVNFPGGWMKKGENPFTALIREVKEETNFDIVPKRLLALGSSKKTSHLEFVVEAELKGEEFKPSLEVENYSWHELHSISDSLDIFGCSLNEMSNIIISSKISFYSFK